MRWIAARCRRDPRGAPVRARVGEGGQEESRPPWLCSVDAAWPQIDPNATKNDLNATRAATRRETLSNDHEGLVVDGDEAAVAGPELAGLEGVDAAGDVEGERDRRHRARAEPDERDGEPGVDHGGDVAGVVARAGIAGADPAQRLPPAGAGVAVDEAVLEVLRELGPRPAVHRERREIGPRRCVGAS